MPFKFDFLLFYFIMVLAPGNFSSLASCTFWYIFKEMIDILYDM